MGRDPSDGVTVRVGLLDPLPAQGEAKMIPPRTETPTPPAPTTRPATVRHARDAAGPFRLSGPARRLVRLLHLVAALGWLGVDVVLAVLAVTAFTSDDARIVAACYTALEIFAVPVLLTLGLTTLASGLVLSLASGWGIVRYWWLTLKLLINVVLSGLVLVLLQPRLGEAGIAAHRIDDTLLERLDNIPTDLLFPGFVSGAALLAASVLGTFKPWGRTPFGRRG